MTTRRDGRTEAVCGSVVAVLLIALTSGVPVWASYLLLWTPLLIAALVAKCRTRSVVDNVARIRFSITWMDLLVGAFVGLLLRVLVIFVELLSVGNVTSSSSMFAVDHNLLWLATAIIAPALFAPFVEELFFRGLVLPAIGVNRNGIVGSAMIFSALHLVYGFNIYTAVTTFIAGIVFAILAVQTKRLGAGITAHVIFNSSLIAMSELDGLQTVGG